MEPRSHRNAQLLAREDEVGVEHNVAVGLEDAVEGPVHTRHLVGWIFCVSGLMAGVSAMTVAYAELGSAVPGSLPAVPLIMVCPV